MKPLVRGLLIGTTSFVALGATLLGTGQWAYNRGVRAEESGPAGFEDAKSNLALAHKLFNRHAAFQLGRIFKEGKLTPADPAAALTWFQAGARRGDPDALAEEARGYFTGKGNAFNAEAGFGAAKAAAEKGSPDGMFITGICFITGTGVKQDTKLGSAWLESGADRGSPMACLLVGFQNLAGTIESVPYPWNPYSDLYLADPVTSPIMNNSDRAHTAMNLNSCLHPSDPTKAEFYLQRASALGMRQADPYLALCIYAKGDGNVPANPEKYVQTLERMTEHGDAWAPGALGACYAFGELGVPTNAEKGAYFLNLASSRGNERAGGLLRGIALMNQESATPKPRWSRYEFYQLVFGKTQDQVLAAVGRPDQTVQLHHTFWDYMGKTYDPLTGKTDASADIEFTDGVVDRITYG